MNILTMQKTINPVLLVNSPIVEKNTNKKSFIFFLFKVRLYKGNRTLIYPVFTTK
jgi:hypothetical protein